MVLALFSVIVDRFYSSLGGLRFAVVVVVVVL